MKNLRQIKPETAFPLARAKRSDQLIIVALPTEAISLQALRLGFGEGSHVICQQTLPGGPVILRAGTQEIAVGFALAQEIMVTSAGSSAAVQRHENHKQGGQHGSNNR